MGGIEALQRRLQPPDTHQEEDEEEFEYGDFDLVTGVVNLLMCLSYKGKPDVGICVYHG